MDQTPFAKVGQWDRSTLQSTRALSMLTIGERLRRVAPSVGPRFRLGRGEIRSVLVTFDDGPNPDTTPALLDLLDRYRARALFFVVGNRVDRAPHMLPETVARGHLLGNHSFTRDRTVMRGFESGYRDIERCQETVERLTNTRPKFFRPPFGELSFNSWRAIRASRLTTVLWTLSSDDWARQTRGDAEEVARLLLRFREMGFDLSPSIQDSLR